MIKIFQASKKAFLELCIFPIVTVIPVSSLVFAVCERQSYTACQQAFSALARDSASHPYPNRSNMPTFVHCGVYSDVCRRTGFCVCRLLGMGRCGNMCIFFYLSLFSFLKIFVVSGLSEKNHTTLPGASGFFCRKPQNTAFQQQFIPFLSAEGEGTCSYVC